MQHDWLSGQSCESWLPQFRCLGSPGFSPGPISFHYNYHRPTLTLDDLLTYLFIILPSRSDVCMRSSYVFYLLYFQDLK